MIYKELYEWGRSELVSCGIEEARLDARLLLEAVCHTGKHDLLVHGGREITEEEHINYVSHIKQRKTHKPLQYILKYQEFMGLNFEVNENVLIPRQDTEILTEEVLRYLHDGQSILDICTGSGCILLSLLHYSNHCRGVGSDISQEALQVAECNAAKLQLAAQFVESDIYDQITGSYDIIVSNPPYIPTAVIDALMAEVREYEPKLALDGGGDGLSMYRKIIQGAGEHLYLGGMLFLEMGYDQAAAVRELMHDAGFKEITVVQDLAGLDRVVSGIYGG